MTRLRTHNKRARRDQRQRPHLTLVQFCELVNGEPLQRWQREMLGQLAKRLSVEATLLRPITTALRPRPLGQDGDRFGLPMPKPFLRLLAPPTKEQ